MLVGYGIGTFAVLQIVEPIMHALHLPDAVLTYTVLALALGFPVAVVLAWAFDINEGHIGRTPPASGQKGARIGPVLVGIGLLAAAPGVVWYFLLSAHAKAGAATATPAAAASIAVLPFVNLSSDKENEYFSDGITEEILNALAQVDGLRVIARTSSFSFKGTNDDVRAIGEKLGVAHLLEGSVRKEGTSVRVTAQLIEVAQGSHLWSHTYDGELKNVFSVEDELARAIVQALKARLAPGAALVRQTTVSSEAHDLYLKGRFFWNQRTKEGIARATALFEQAIAIDPGYALAHSGLADGYQLSVDYGGARWAEASPKARAHAIRAVELDDGLAEAHASLGHVSEQDYDRSGAEREYKRAIELRPGYATAHQWYALNLLDVGRLPEAQAEAELARQLDPTSFIISNLIAVVLFDRRAWDRAIEQSRKALELNPGFSGPRVLLVESCLQAGKFAEAQAALDEPTPTPSRLDDVRAEVLAASGKRAEARRLLTDLERRSGTEPLSPGQMASAYVALGDKDAAFAWLARGIEERDQSLSDLMASPSWIRSARIPASTRCSAG